jgi:hypothetical protein
MKKMLFVILLFIALNSGMSLYAQHTVNLHPVADVYMRTLGGGDGHCSFMKFDISSIPPGNNIDSAELAVYVHKMSTDYALNNDMLFMHMDNQDWVEGDNSDIVITDTVIQEDGLVAGLGWSYSVDLAQLLVYDYGISNTYFTVVMKDSNDMTVMPPYFEYPEDKDDSLVVGLLPKYIVFYPHEYGESEFIPELTVDYTIIPDITDESGDSAKCEGDNVSFSVSATGDTPLYYQWQKDGIDIPGATESAFSISSITADTAGNYRCIVTNSGGADTSEIKVLTVYSLPTVVILGPDTACGSAMLDEGVGMPGDIYLWSTDETTQIITVTESGNYRLTVIDGNGCAGSDDIDVVIYPLPYIELGNDTSIVAGSSLLLDAGEGHDSYLWSNDSTTRTILVDSTGTGLGAATYYVTVTEGECQSVDSITVTYIMSFTDIAIVHPPGGFSYSCQISEETDVPAMLMNIGNTVIPANDTIFGFYRVDNGAEVADTMVLLSDIYNGNTFVFSFDQKADMGEYRLYDYKIYFYYKNDQNADNDTVNGQVERITAPVINLGNDTALCDNKSIVLDAGEGYHGYEWSDYSSGQTLTVDISNASNGPNTFFVTVYFYDCIASDTIEITFITCMDGVDTHLNQQTDFSTYLSGNDLNILFTGAANREIDMQIVNLQGQIVLSEVYTGTSERFVKQVNVSGYPAGAYIIKVRINSITKTGKFVIKY